jgi:hypothetical protein
MIILRDLTAVALGKEIIIIHQFFNHLLKQLLNC